MFAIDWWGYLYAWGNNAFGSLGLGTEAATVPKPQQLSTDIWLTWDSIAVGKNHAMGLSTNGTLYSWGSNEFGQLGFTNTDQERSPRPVFIQNEQSKWDSIAAGGYHSMAIKDNKLWAWGNNGCGQLGTGDFNNRNEPTEVNHPVTGRVWVRVELGMNFSVAVDTESKLWVWGCNDFGQLGNGEAFSNIPIEVE